MTQIFIPGLHEGLWRLRSDDDLRFRPTLRKPIDLRICCDSLPMKRQGLQFADVLRNHYSAETAFGFPSILTLAKGLRILGDVFRIGDRDFLSGAPGMRLRNRISLEEGPPGVLAFEQSLLGASAVNAGPIPLTTTDPDVWRGLPLVIPARNLWNFYHFTTETLPMLTLARDYGHRGEIVIAVANATKRRAFIEASLSTWFPEVMGRLRFTSALEHLTEALVPFNARLYHHMAHPDQMPDLAPMLQRGMTWGGRRATARNLRIIAMNGFDTALVGLRDAASRVEVESAAVAALPRRLYIRRKPGPETRSRPVGGEEALVAMLAGLGFGIASFEDFTPAEQAAITRRSEILISPHGAGMTNMLFAAPGALFIELSHLQALTMRFGDFSPVAFASGATYVHFIVDHMGDSPDEIPDFDLHSIVGQNLSPAAIASLRAVILRHIDPEGHEALRDAARGLHEGRDWAPLLALLESRGDQIASDADLMVWAGNAARNLKRPRVALRWYLNALFVAPRRPILWDRIERLARGLGESLVLGLIARHRAVYADLAEWHSRATQARSGTDSPDEAPADPAVDAAVDAAVDEILDLPRSDDD